MAAGTSGTNMRVMPSAVRTYTFQKAILSRRRLSAMASKAGDFTGAPSPILASSVPSPALSFVPTPSNDPDQRARPSPPPNPRAVRTATTIMTAAPRMRFLYSAPRFLHVPVNTRVPEVCLLGRSNVGKSTLLNALAGNGGATAGRAHGPAARRAGLAVTSAKAGCTKTMNAYGFGSPLSRVAVISAENDELEEDEEDDDDEREEDEDEDDDDVGEYMNVATPGRKGRRVSGATRRERRLTRKKTRDTSPSHALVVVDMPGYGLGSQDEWGVEINKYLQRRAMLRGAVVLIDSVAGVKGSDRDVLAMLRDARIRTTVVLTKADKLGYGARPEGHDAISAACHGVWKALRTVERRGDEWAEGNGWDSEIWVTGAGDRGNGGGLGMEGARMAICKMAGLVEDTRKSTWLQAASSAPAKVIPFDQIQWAQPQETLWRRQPSF